LIKTVVHTTLSIPFFSKATQHYPGVTNSYKMFMSSFYRNSLWTHPTNHLNFKIFQRFLCSAFSFWMLWHLSVITSQGKLNGMSLLLNGMCTAGMTSPQGIRTITF